MEVLIYGNRKQDDEIYDISTPEKELAAYLVIFKSLDEYWNVYDDIKDVKPLAACSLCRPCVAGLHECCTGNECLCELTEKCISRSRYFRSRQMVVLSRMRLYELAKAGDGAAAKKLMNERKNNEYESIRIEEIRDPLQTKARKRGA